MPDNNTQNKSAVNDIVTVDLVNPTRARRVIFDGIADSNKSIVVEAGATKKNVRISKMIEMELHARNRAKKDSDLIPVKSDQNQTAA